MQSLATFSALIMEEQMVDSNTGESGCGFMDHLAATASCHSHASACSDILRKGQKYIKISLDDIRSYDAQLAHDLADDPSEHLPLVGLPAPVQVCRKFIASLSTGLFMELVTKRLTRHVNWTKTGLQMQTSRHDSFSRDTTT